MTQVQEKDLLKLVTEVKKANPETEIVLYGTSESFFALGIEEESWQGVRILHSSDTSLSAIENCIYVMPLNKIVQPTIFMLDK